MRWEDESGIFGMVVGIKLQMMGIERSCVMSCGLSSSMAFMRGLMRGELFMEAK